MIFLNRVLVSILFLALFSFKDYTTCQDFKEGYFSVKMLGETSVHYWIDRTENEQIETNEYGEKVYYAIEWINDCSFIQKFDKNKMKLTDDMKMINNDGGVVVELLEVENDKCIYYQSYVRKFKEISLRKGKFCKID